MDLLKSNPDFFLAIVSAIGSVVGTMFVGLIIWLLKIVFKVKADVDQLIANDSGHVDKINSLRAQFEKNEGEYMRIFDSIWDTSKRLEVATSVIETNWADFRRDADEMKEDFKAMREGFVVFTQEINKSISNIQIEVAKARST